MKKLITFIVSLLISVTSFAQTGFNYKAIVKDDIGNILSSSPLSIKFSIYEGEALTNKVYEETTTTNTDSNGLLIHTIGEGATSDNLFDINWGNGNHWMEVEINTGSGFIIMGPAIQFNTVPYALHAKSATFKTVNNITSNSTGNLYTDSFVFGSSQMDRVDGTSLDNSRMFFNKTKSAFRAGKTGSDGNYTQFYWDDDNIGFNSVAFGNGTEASGLSSVAFGSGSVALGDYSIALGLSSRAVMDNSIAMGSSSYAEGIHSVAIGQYARARSYGEVAIGNYNHSDPIPSIDSWDENDYLFTVGNGTSSFETNNALTILKNGKTGINTYGPRSIFEVLHFNGAPSTSDLTNALSIRNLGLENNFSDDESWQLYTEDNGYLLLFRNGSFRGAFNATSGAYGQASDRRLKKDITALENGTLNKVMQLNPVSYLMKDQIDTKRNLGLISQEVQELFPSITHYVKGSDVMALSYTELIPVLIKALQEQQAIIEQQNAQIETLLTDNSLLKEKDDTQDKSIEALVSRLNLLESKSSH